MKKTLLVFTAACAALMMVGASAFAKPKKQKKVKAVTVENAMPEGEVTLLDGFEEGNFWLAVGDSWDQWGSHNLSLEAEDTTEWFSEGTTGAIWTYDIATENTSCQASFYTNSLIETDWTGVKYLVLDVYNPNPETIGMKASTQNGVDWVWSSTDDVEIPSGITKNVCFDFTVHGIGEAQQIACCIIDVTGENKGGFIYVDNIRIVR